jgi:hypothetical protein
MPEGWVEFGTFDENVGDGVTLCPRHAFEIEDEEAHAR